MAKKPRKKKARIGRPPGSGKPVELVRRNRVVVMLTDGELATLREWTAEVGLAQGTLAHEIIVRALKRRP